MFILPYQNKQLVSQFSLHPLFMPSFKSLLKKKQKLENHSLKVNIVNLFVQNEKKCKTPNHLFGLIFSQKRMNQFDQVLEKEIIDVEKLQKLSWNGIPPTYRSKVWKILLKYTSSNKANHELSLKNKRRDYFNLVSSYIDNPNVQHDNHEKKMLKLIRDDVIRTMPSSPLFRETIVQQMMQRILYVWHIRHPSSGYVQGLNDIVTPFLIVFLSDYVKIDMKNIQATSELGLLKPEDLNNVQADCYWCFTKALNGVLDNYANSWPGIIRSFQHIKQIFNRVDPGFLKHFEAKGIDFYHIYFKWVTCLLLRQFSTQTGLRLFDSFISLESTEESFFNFLQYVFVAIFLKFSKQLKKLNFEQLMAFQHKMPTKTWNQEQIETIIAEAFVYQNFFTSQ